MGYNTNFQGELLFAKEMTQAQLAALKSILGHDIRDHPEWDMAGFKSDTGWTGPYYIDLEFNDKFTGIQWSGAAKTYHLDQLVNVVIREMQKQFPDFGFYGAILAQGDEVKDRWLLTIGDDGFAHKMPIAVLEKKVTCPFCQERFALEGGVQ